jgi:hypothetical protein
MANALYDFGREAFLDGDIDWIVDTIRTFFVDSADYTASLTTHDFLDDVAVAGRIGGAGTAWNQGQEILNSSSPLNNGVADGDDTTHPAVSGDQAEYILIYEADTSDAASRLIALIDTATGLPVTPNGGDITIQWDSGSNRIFKL